MSSEFHPELETLLLWQTGELEPDQAREVQRHVASCASCREQLDSFEDLYRKGDRVSSLLAEKSLHVRFAKEKNRYRWARNSWPGAVAAGLIVALLLYTTDFTPSAQAETLLHKAIARESDTPFHPHTLRISVGGRDCSVAFAQRDTPALQIPASGAPVCTSVSQQLRSVGWDWNTALSAKSFAQWRASLPRKHDAIHKTSEFTEVSTQTEDGLIHEATLRLRNTDYEAISAKVQVASNGPDTAIEIEEAPYTPTVETAAAPVTTPVPVTSHSVVEPILSPLDRSEAEVWLTLHRIGADTNILLAASRESDSIRVWGVAPSPDAKASIVRSLRSIPDVSLAVTAEGEQKASQSTLPWQAAHGDGPPLAYGQVNDLFKDDDDGRRKFLNDLDTISIRILGESKSRDALLALAAHDRTVDYGTSLRNAADDLGKKLLVDQRLLGERLGPVYAAFQRPVPKQVSPLSYAQATEVYLLIHKLFIADDSGETLTADAALEKLQKLPL